MDGLFSHSVDGSNMFKTEPGMCSHSWGYHNIGNITLNDEMDGQMVRHYGTGDWVGCHFDKIMEVAFFSVNGQIVGEYAGKSSVLVEQNLMSDQANQSPI